MKNEAVMVSFIVTIYNKINYIPYCIDSIESQYLPWVAEYIFIDDGSTDGSMEYVEERTRNWENCIYVRQSNKGPAIATNIAANKARGRWLKLLDADDVLAPWATHFLIGEAEKIQVARLDATARYRRVAFPDGIDFPTAAPEKAAEVVHGSLEKMLRNGWAGTSNILVRREEFIEVGGCDERLFVQDFSLPLRLAKLGDIGVVDAEVSLAPISDTERIMDNGAQVIHDLTATHYYFVKDNPDLSDSVLKRICVKAAGRAYRWRTRECGEGKISILMWRYLLARLFKPRSPERFLHLCMRAISKDQNIR